MEKLVFVHDGPLFYDENGNYYEFAYHELLQRYSYLADEISFLIRTKPSENGEKFTPVPDEIQITDVPNFKSPKTLLKNRPIAEKIIEKSIIENDIIILRLPSSIAQIAFKYVKKYQKPYIVECVGCAWDSYWNHGWLGKLIAPYMYFKTKNIVSNCKYVYYVTTQFLQKRYPSHGYSVCCSNVVLNKVNESIINKRLKKIFNFNPTQKLILGTAAAIDTRYKGQEFVIRAIPALLSKGYNVEYHLAGGITGQKNDSYLYDLAKKLGVSNRVIFKGSISADEMNEYYDDLDIYIQPSKQEGLPRAVIEAMARGCPCIGTNIAGIPELIQEKFLFSKGSSQAVVDAVECLLKSDLNKVAQDNFKTAQKYEKEKLSKKRTQFYDIFLQKNNL